jgi:hypothetical protein
MTDHAQLSPVSVESMRTPVRNQNVFMIDDVPIQHYRFPMPICHCQKVDVSIYLEHVVGRSNVAGTNGCTVEISAEELELQNLGSRL